jgi:hypothetical protein
MTHPEYLLAGHSHIFSMGASQDYRGPLDLIRTEDGLGYIVMQPWSGGRSNAYWEKVVEASSGRDVLISFNGNQHHGSFLFAPNPLFDLFDESNPEMLHGVTVVPRRLVQSHFDPSLNQLRELVPRILSAGCRSIRCWHAAAKIRPSCFRRYDPSLSFCASFRAKEQDRSRARRYYTCFAAVEAMAHRSGAHLHGRTG